MSYRRDQAGSLSSEQQAQLERLVAKFHAAWSRGERPTIEAFLPAEGPLRRAALDQLVQAEIEFRRQAGEAAAPHEYLDRFPELRPDLAAIQRLVAAAGTGAKHPAIPDDDESLHLKPEPPRDAQRTKVTQGPSAPGSAKETAAISSSEIAADTDGGSGGAGAQESGGRMYAGLKRGVTLGNYLILDKLGKGGMGTVFRAEHRRMLREVALKVLSPEVLKAPQAVQRFHREVRVTAKLTHPNIVTAYDADEEQGVHFLVMELVEGSNLAALVKREGPLPVRQAVDFVVQAARGLDYAHSKGIIHRDVKPGNLMLDKFGMVKILDLGLARLDESSGGAGADITDTGNVMGTIDYLPPEQAVNTKNADQRSDIYSLGCTLWFLLTGKPIYGGQTPVERILAHRDRPAPSLRKERNDVSQELEAVFRQMVAKLPEDRYQSMGEVLQAFERCHLGGNESAASGYMLVAPPADEIPLADKSFAIEQAVAPPVASTAVPAPRGQGGTKRNERSSPAGGRRTSNRPTPAMPAVDPEKSLALGRRVVTAAMITAGLVFLVALTSLLIWALNRSPATQEENSGQNSIPEPPPRLIAPFSTAEARAQQDRCKEFLGEPVEKRNLIGMSLILVPPGEFDMGTAAADLVELLDAPASPVTQAQYRTESPQRHVTVAAPFYMSAHEVTQAEYEQLMGLNPSWFSTSGEGSDKVVGGDTSRHPVERVPWLDAIQFCNRLSDKEGLDRCYVVDRGTVSSFVAANGYRLPTEAEWEYACRAGTTGKFGIAEGEAGIWNDARSNGKSCPVGTTKPNSFGIYEMHGNVWEWCHNDDNESRPERLQAEPVAGHLRGDAERVVRGGSWNDAAIDCRSAVRSGQLPTFASATIGFRVVVPVSMERRRRL